METFWLGSDQKHWCQLNSDHSQHQKLCRKQKLSLMLNFHRCKCILFTGIQCQSLILREHTKNDSVKTFYPAETLLTSSQETTLMPHTVRYSTQWFILLHVLILLSGGTKGGPSTEINNRVELIYKQVAQNNNIEYCNLSWYYFIKRDVAWRGHWK